MESIQAEIVKFIAENFLHGAPADSVAPDDSFMEKGIIDSTGILELVGFIEKKFGFKIQDEELTPDNLDTIARVVGFVEKKMGVPATGARNAG